MPSNQVPERERDRRRSFLESAMARAGVDHVLLYSANRVPGAVTWLTGWPVTREAVVLATAGEPDVLWIGFPNHVPNAVRMCPAADVRPAGVGLGSLILAELKRRGASRVATLGAWPGPLAGALATEVQVVSLDQDLIRFRLIKSADEIEVLRASAALTDRGAAALLDAAANGATESEAVGEFVRVCANAGAYSHIAYVATTSLQAPDRTVPGQWPTDRIIDIGNVLTFELSAAVEPDYPGQLLRTVTVSVLATPKLASLHEVAVAVERSILAAIRPGTLPSELLAIASEIVAAAGFVTVDDVVHGFGGGYLPPILSLAHPDSAPLFDEPLLSGMALVVQPNVCDSDLNLGVQTGELVVVTADGFERLHTTAKGLLVI
jgi:Xaa-Pro dipeptidase